MWKNHFLILSKFSTVEHIRNLIVLPDGLGWETVRNISLIIPLALEFAQTLAIFTLGNTFGIEVPKERCTGELPASSRLTEKPVHLHRSWRWDLSAVTGLEGFWKAWAAQGWAELVIFEDKPALHPQNL